MELCKLTTLKLNSASWSVCRGQARQTRRRLQLTKTRARKTEGRTREGGREGGRGMVAKTVSGGYLARQGANLGGASELAQFFMTRLVKS